MSDAKTLITEPRNKIAGRLLIVAAAVMWSTSGLFVKSPMLHGWPGPVLAFWRAALATLVLLPMVRRPSWSWKLVPMMLIFAAMNWFFLSAMVETTAANAIWLQYTAPVWVFLAGALWLKEPIQPCDWLLLVLAGLGVGLIVLFECRSASPAGIVYGLVSGMLYAGVAISLRWLRDWESAWLVALNHLATALVLSPYLFAYPHLWPSGGQWLVLAGLGVFQLGLPYLLFARGLKTVPSHQASGLTLLEPVLVPVWVFLAWRNTATYMPVRWWTLVGGGLILLGLLLRYAGGSRRRQA